MIWGGTTLKTPLQFPLLTVVVWCVQVFIKEDLLLGLQLVLCVFGRGGPTPLCQSPPPAAGGLPNLCEQQSAGACVKRVLSLRIPKFIHSEPPTPSVSVHVMGHCMRWIRAATACTSLRTLTETGERWQCPVFGPAPRWGSGVHSWGRRISDPLTTIGGGGAPNCRQLAWVYSGVLPDLS